MAKPILVIKIPAGFLRECEKVKEAFKKETDNEYHVIITATPEVEVMTIECFNDAKGLPDIDIEALIKSIKNGED